MPETGVGFYCECLWEKGFIVAPSAMNNDTLATHFSASVIGFFWPARASARRCNMRVTSSMSPGLFSARTMSSASAAMPISSSFVSSSSSCCLMPFRSSVAGIR